MDTLLKMSTKELSRMEVMQRLSEKRMSQKEAGRILNLEKKPEWIDFDYSFYDKTLTKLEHLCYPRFMKLNVHARLKP